MPDIFLVEHRSQVQDLLNRGMRDAGYWLALGPSAMWALEKEGITYKIPEDFHNAEELERLCLETHQKVEWLCHRLDEHLGERYSELEEWGIRPFLFHIFPIVQLFDVLVSRIFQLRAILSAYPGCRVWAHVAEPKPWAAPNILFSSGETLWGRLLSLPGWDSDLELLPPPDTGKRDKEAKSPGQRMQKRLEGFVVRRLKMRSLITHSRAQNWKGLQGLLGQGAAGAILINNGAYEWAGIVPLLAERGWRLLFAEDRFFRSQPGKGEDGERGESGAVILSEPEVARCFQSQGISFYPLLEDRFQWILETSVGGSRGVTDGMSRLVRKYRVRALLTATDTTFISHTVSQAARYLGLPVICWQHGFVGGNNGNIQMNEYNDLLTSQALFTYGDAVSSAYRRFTARFPAHIVSVGAPSIDRIGRNGVTARTNNTNHAVRRILYATAFYYGNVWYCGFSPPFSDCVLYREQSAIAGYLESLLNQEAANYAVTLKLPPGYGPGEPGWAVEVSARSPIRLVRRKPSFTRLLGESEIIIIDSPTTTILQAAATQKPLFVLTGIIGYPERARRMLEKRAVCSASAGELMARLGRYLETGVYEADVRDNEFLKAYGTHLGDGASDRRAMAALDRIIERF